MSQYLVVGAGILVAGAAAVTLYGVFKRRLLLMSAALTIMIFLLALQQIARHETDWPVYVLFASATLGLVSTIVQYARRQGT